LRFLLVAFALVAPAVAATSSRVPAPYIAVSSDRSTYARFVPKTATRGGSGTVFRLLPDGSEAVLWKVGWYSPAVEVSTNGDLVSLAPIARPDAKYLDAPALSIYPRGQQKPRVFTIGEVVQNRARLECDEETGVSWRAYVPPIVMQGNTFRVVTVEGIELAFDASTGTIIGTRQLEPGQFSTMGFPRCVP
jgi:hypothetical protein